MRKATKNHDNIVEDISNTIRQAIRTGKKLKIYHGDTNSTRQQEFQKDSIINTSKLNNVLEIDLEKQEVIVEPKVTMAQLFEYTFKHELMPQVVMEFPEITAGGGVAGVSGESSSFKYGGFHEGVVEYEVVLGDGRVVTANEETNSDLFRALPGSYGTLGVITKLKLKLVPARQFVKLSYIRTNSLLKTKKLMIQNSKTDVNFIDGMLISKDFGLVMVGELSDKIDLPVSNFGHWWNEWFYIHAQKVAQSNEEYQELVPIKDYLFRYDRGAFWVGKFVFERMRTPFNRFSRVVFSPFMKTKRLYRGLQVANVGQEYLIQDYCLPSASFEQMHKLVDEELNIYPIWLLPIKAGDKSRLSPGYIDTDIILNMGVYGKLFKSNDKFVDVNKRLEKALRDLNGRKVLYAHSYFSRKEFWSIYDKRWYDEIRDKYSASQVFPNIYDKVSVTGKYRGSIARGVVKFFLPPYKLPLR